MTAEATATALTETPLRDRLVTRGFEFDFCQAVWLLERLAGAGVHVGERGPVSEEPITFRPDVSVGFPATDVRRVEDISEKEGDRPRYRVEVTFLGLYGVSTPLPLHYAIDVLRSVDPRSPYEDDAAEQAGPNRATQNSPQRSFLDLLHHRLTSLFYRAWVKYRYDKAFGLPGRDGVTEYLRRLIGLPEGDLAEVIGLEPIRMLRYAGPMTQHPKSAIMLEGMLNDYIDSARLRVQQFLGRWVPLSEADQNRIGGVNCSLGIDLTVGEEVFDLSGAFRVIVGPVDWETYKHYLPGADGFATVRSLVELYRDDPLAFSIDVELLPNQVPETQLGSGDSAGRLGFTSWSRTHEMPATTVRFDATLSIEQHHHSPEVVAGAA